jgi:hypothetical protein
MLDLTPYPSLCTAVAFCQSSFQGRRTSILRKETRPKVGYRFEEVLPHLDNPP